MVDVIGEHIEIVPGAGGPKPRIAGHRIRVLDVVVWHEKLGMSHDEIVHHHPTITLADVHAALAYYWDHRDEIETQIAQERAFASQFADKTRGSDKREIEPPPWAGVGFNWTNI